MGLGLFGDRDVVADERLQLQASACWFVSFPPTVCSLSWYEELCPGTSGDSLPLRLLQVHQALIMGRTPRQAHRVAEKRFHAFHFWLCLKLVSDHLSHQGL